MKAIGYRIYHWLIIAGLLSSVMMGCGKNESAPPATNPPSNPPPTTPPSTTPKTCSFTGMIQQNSGGKPDFALTVSFNGSNPTKLIVYDSLANKKNLESNFTYVTTDSIRIDQYQYVKLDAFKRVIVYETLSDLSTPATADKYRYEYIYSRSGNLITKYLYVNGSKNPFYTSSYTYTNELLTKCIVIVDGNTNWKIIESDLSYDANTTAKGWLYTIPDAFESYLYSTVFSFGNKPARPLARAVTKVFNPISGTVLDTWTTNYGSYQLNADGYIISATASGDQQQGMAGFFGKTAFVYKCQ